MATGRKCFNCGKGIMIGHNVSHAKNRTRKVFKPNLHAARIIVGGTPMKVRLCTKCLRMVKGSKPSVKIVEEKIAEAPTFSEDSKGKSEVSSVSPAAAGLV